MMFSYQDVPHIFSMQENCLPSLSRPNLYYVEILLPREGALHSRKEVAISMLRGDEHRAVGMGRKETREREKKIREVKESRDP